MTLVSIFFIILITAFAVVAFFTEPSKADKLIHTRLASLDRKRVSSGIEEPDIVKEITFSTIPTFDKFLRNNRIAIGLQLLIEQCDLQWTVGRIVFGTLVLVCLGAVVGNWWIAPGLLGWAPGLALGAAPYLFLLQKRKLRLRRFSELLPEFRRAADEQSFGLPFREAMINLSRRVPVTDLQFLVTAILVQKETGGNLAQILDKASHVIRERVGVAGQMRIRTAQGRLTGWILCALPFVIFIALNFLNPGYGKSLFQDPLGQKLVTYAAIMMVIGMLVIRKIVNIKY